MIDLETRCKRAMRAARGMFRGNEDIAQQAALEVCKTPHEHQFNARILALRAGIDYLRRFGSHRRNGTPREFCEWTDNLERFYEVPAQDMETILGVRQVLSDMPQELREALIQVYLCDRTQLEYGHSKGKSEAWASIQMRKARIAFQARWLQAKHADHARRRTP